MFALNQISYQNLLHVYILLFKEHFKISSEMTLFIEFHVYIYIVYAYFLYPSLEIACILGLQTTVADVIGMCVLLEMTLPIQRSFLDSIK